MHELGLQSLRIGIVPEVVELFRVFLKVEDFTLLEIAVEGDLVARVHVAHGMAFRGVVLVLADDVVARRVRLAAPVGREILARHGAWGSDAGCVEKGGCEIDEGGEALAARARLDMPGQRARKGTLSMSS